MSANVAHPAMYQTLQKAAGALGLEMFAATGRVAADLEAAFASIIEAKCDAVIVLADPPRPRIVNLAAAAHKQRFVHGRFAGFDRWLDSSADLENAGYWPRQIISLSPLAGQRGLREILAAPW
jgi:DNA-binding LacI/PurR family transcriptional regulator